jgi:hypothetical protein
VNTTTLLVERAVEHWQVLLTVSTAVLYAFMHVAYSIFYSRFGLTIGDAGLSLADLVAPTVLYLVVLVGGWLLVIFMWLGFAKFIISSVRATRGGEIPVSPARSSVLVAEWALCLAVILTVVSIPVAAALDARRAANGHPVTPGGPLGVRLTGWSALWAAPLGRSEKDACLLYLGRDGSVGAFWNADSQQTVLLDVDGLVSYGTEMPDSTVCRAPR